MKSADECWLDEVKWHADGLVPAIAQEAGTGKVLTLAWMNREALEPPRRPAKRTTGRARGASSGARASNRATCSSVQRDPARLRQRRDPRSSSSRSAASPATRGASAASSSGSRTDRWERVEPVLQGSAGDLWSRLTPARGGAADDVLDRLAATIAARRGADPASSYVAALFAKGDDAILKKIGEEATETVMAAKDGDKLRIAAEVADLWFHCLVLLAQPRSWPGRRPRRARAARRRVGHRGKGAQGLTADARRANACARREAADADETSGDATVQDCIFCKIVRGEIPSKKVYEDDDVLAFHDIHPQAPVHFMLIPKRHIASLADATPDDAGVLGRMHDARRAARARAGLAGRLPDHRQHRPDRAPGRDARPPARPRRHEAARADAAAQLRRE